MSDRIRRANGRWALEAQPGYLAGVELASPEVQELVRRKARWKKQWTNPPVVVPSEDFVSMADARRSIRWPDARQLITPGLLQVAYRSSDGEEGVTRLSYDREVRWRHRATRWDVVRRQVRILFGPLVGSWRYPADT